MRIIGEGGRELYFTSGDDKKWSHAQAGGKWFDSFQDAEADYQSKHKNDWKFQVSAFIGIMLLIAVFHYLFWG